MWVNHLVEKDKLPCYYSHSVFFFSLGVVISRDKRFDSDLHFSQNAVVFRRLNTMPGALLKAKMVVYTLITGR